MASNEHEVPAAKLCPHLNPDALGFETTDDVPPIDDVVGQDRALRALEFGLHVATSGYHIYAAGPAGTGKMTAVRRALERAKGGRPTPQDWCYVFDFERPDEPRALALPPGRGAALVSDMRHVVEQAKETIPRAFESEGYTQRRAQVVRELAERREAMSREVEEEGRRQGFAIEATPMGVVTVPLVEGRPLTKEEFNGLPEEQRRALEQKGHHLQEQLEQAMRRGHVIEHEAQVRVQELDREIARVAIDPLLNEVRQKYADLPEVLDYLQRVYEDIPNHLGDFRRGEGEEGQEIVAAMLRDDHLGRYRVNLFVDNAQTDGPPIVVEHQPTYYNLCGRVEYRSKLGSMATDFTLLKAGAIQRANGGYLVMEARDVLANPMSWEALKRTLLCREARLENLGEQYVAIPAATIRPQPIPLDVKVVLIGPPTLYYLLKAYDEDFRRLFGVRADFDVDVERDAERVAQYAAVISALARREKLAPFDKRAVARIVDFAARLAEHQERLSTRFDEISRLAREASFWAGQNGHRVVTADDVERALAEQEYRASLLEERVRRFILERTVRIATEGEAVGRVNGLSVIAADEHGFGHPVRITARTALGMRGVVNVEREIELSGRIHSKGVLILGGYLSGTFAQDKPLALSATLTFEQTYDEVEGDSASSAELYAILSSLSGLPIKQGIAVTGAVNQQGEVQAIGGVNEKIEGFYRICKERSLNGEQGVIIPRDNVKHLMLRDEVVAAVEEGKFHVWAIETVDEGIALLTGVAAGRRAADGSYPPGTVNQLVDQQLALFAERLKGFGPSGSRADVTPLRQIEAREAAERLPG